MGRREREAERKRKEEEERKKKLMMLGTITAGGIGLLGAASAVAANILIPKKAVLVLGESGAGKDTLLHILKGDGFKRDTIATDRYKDILLDLKLAYKIKVINTSGSKNTLLNTEEAKEKKYDTLCYVFNAEKYDIDNDIKLGIRNAVQEARYKNIERVFAIGTRGASISNISNMENIIRKEGIKCKIFEFSHNPRKELIKFLFDIDI
ncbi:hypothetical protein R4J09_02595 [Brachyspira intermedia]|uniref:hypothetical protein n=1 Tax=Brachyspira intermedia TaxID=84377 RepID=UPI0030056075